MKLNWIFDRVDNSQLIFFRISFGALMWLESWGAIGTGWVKRAFIDSQFTFTFIGFEWLQFLHGEVMYAYYILMGLVSFCVMIGFRYRIFSIVLFVMWTSTYLLQKTHYNNHYYLVVLLCAFMVLVPANGYASYDAKMGQTKQSCPRWANLIFQVQVTIVYFYASLNKLYPDWLHADPARIWMSMKSYYPLIGDLLRQEWMPYFISYGGIAFDALIIPGLLWKRTRLLAFGMSLFFHLFNSVVFQIGIFPYVMVAISAFFFPVDQVRRLIFKRKEPFVEIAHNGSLSVKQRVFVYALGMYFILQMFLPLRHHLFRGDVNWTEEGHRMAWRMMLRSKSGGIRFMVVDNLKKDTLEVSPGDYLTSKQSHAVATRPDMTWQFVQFLKYDLDKKGISDYSIYAHSWARVNRRGSAPIIKPGIDLAEMKWDPFSHSTWLTEAPAFKKDP